MTLWFSSSSFIENALTLAILVAVIPAIYCLILFHRRSKLERLHLRGWLSLTQGIFAIASALFFSFKSTWLAQWTTCYTMQLLVTLISRPLTDILVVRIYQYYTLSRMNVMPLPIFHSSHSVTSSSQEEAREKRRSFMNQLRIRVRLKCFRTKYVLTFLLIWGIVRTVPIGVMTPLMSPEVFKTSPDQCLENHWVELSEIINVAVEALIILAVLRLSFLTYSVSDVMGIIKEIKSICGSFLLTGLIYSIHTFVVPEFTLIHASVWIALLYVYLFVTIIVVPLRKTYTPSGSMKKTGSIKGQPKLLARFLESHYDVFMKFCDSEYSGENLAFFSTVNEFEKKFDKRSPEENAFHAILIYVKFVAENAPLAVNLTSKTALPLRTEAFKQVTPDIQAKVQLFLNGNALDSNSTEQIANFKNSERALLVEAKTIGKYIFSAAKREILILMTNDTLHRFRQTPGYKTIWKAFIRDTKEANRFNAAKTRIVQITSPDEVEWREKK